jgi:GTP pyrophosphokinase
LFEDRIFVFTPKGDVIDLPRGASPLDFAYQIHTEVGHHTDSVKINNKLSSLNASLESGDIVEIQTNESRSPSRKWLEYVKTAQAKQKIRKYLDL